jgi:hypothetical protein
MNNWFFWGNVIWALVNAGLACSVAAAARAVHKSWKQCNEAAQTNRETASANALSATVNARNAAVNHENAAMNTEFANKLRTHYVLMTKD